MRAADVAPVTYMATCSFCRRDHRERPNLRFYIARGLAVCETCIDILSDLLEGDRSGAPTTPQRPTPRLSNVELQQVNSPP